MWLEEILFSKTQLSYLSCVNGGFFLDPLIERSQLCAEDLCSKLLSDFFIPYLHMVVETYALGLGRLITSSQEQPQHQFAWLSLRFSIPFLFLTHGDASISLQIGYA